MRNIHSFIIGSLTAVAIFIIFNCAGYMLITFMSPAILAPETAGPAAGNMASVGLNEVDIVTFRTPTATPNPPPPIPLLSTVTGRPAADTVILLVTNTPPAAQPTPTPINRAEPRQTADPSQLEILSHRTYIDSLGWHHIVGEVQNKADTPMEFVEVMAKLYDENEKVIGTKLTFTTPDIIFPGGKAPFDVITLRPSQWQRIMEYRLQIKGQLAEDLLSQEIILLNQNSYIQNGFLYVTGEVQNSGQSSALVKLIVTLYDANLTVINTNWSYANLGVIPSNQISPFEVKVVHTTDPNNFSYRIQIEEETIETGAEIDASK